MITEITPARKSEMLESALNDALREYLNANTEYETPYEDPTAPGWVIEAVDLIGYPV